MSITQNISTYFSDVWSGITTTLKGMRLTIRYFFSPSVTMEYPEVKPQIPEGHRGFHIYNEEQCILCQQCVRACPVDCIALKGLGKGKDTLITQYDIDYSKCLFCNLCCEACGPECLFLGPDYDRAAAQRAGCVLHLARTKTPEEIEAFKAELEKREAEKKAKAAALAAEKAKTSEAPQ